MSKKVFFILIISAVVFFFTCKQPEKIAPPIPQSNSFVIDLSYFSAPDTGSNTVNYALAYRNISFWKFLFEDSLALHKNLFASVSDKKLEYQDNNTWLISEEFTESNDTYLINYFEIIKDDTVFTKLFISLDSTYLYLPVFDGWFLPDSTNGFWQLNKPDTGNTYVKYIKTDRNFISEYEQELKVTYLYPDENNGNYILIKDSLFYEYDIYIDIFEKITENHTYIQFGQQSLVGKVKDLQYFGDTLWHYWNENRVDN